MSRRVPQWLHATEVLRYADETNPDQGMQMSDSGAQAEMQHCETW